MRAYLYRRGDFGAKELKKMRLDLRLKVTGGPILMKRLKLSLDVSISHSAISSASVLTLSWRFVFGAVKRDWLLIHAIQTTINVHYFFFVVLGLVINSLPYPAAMMIIIFKNTRMSFTFYFSV
jgi:hypothetical protein